MIAITQALNKILQTKDYNFIIKNALDRDYFKGYEDEYDFIIDHYNRFGLIPDRQTFIDKFDTFTIFDVEEPDSYIVDKLYEERGYNKFQEIIPRLSEYLKADSRDAYEFLQSQMANLKPHSVATGVNIISQAMERYEVYANRGKDPDKATIKTGMVELDEIFGGWEFGDELVTIVARTNMGKSWMLMKHLAEAWKQGYNVGLYSGEMNHIKLGYRFDALFGHFSNRALSLGSQTDGYEDFIKKLSSMPNPFIICTQKDFGGRPTVQKIKHFIEANNIQIMGIDQFSLMEDGRAGMRDPTRIRMCHVAEDLFLASSEFKIPILGLAQANREGAKKEADDEAPGLENIKECDDIAANSSKCIGMKQSSFGLVLDIIKNREGKVGDKLLYSWDIDTGHFAYIPSSGDAASNQTRTQAVQQSKGQFKVATSINPF